MACFSQLGLIYFTLSLLKWRGTGRSWIIWHWHFVFWSSGILLIFFSYNKKPKERGWWACLHECEFRLLFPWEIFFFPPLPLLLSVIDGVMGWRGFLLAKNVLNSPHVWEHPWIDAGNTSGVTNWAWQSLRPGLTLGQEVLVDWTLEKHEDGWRDVEMLLLGWTGLWNASSGKTEANSIQCKEWIYVPGPAARTCWMHPRSVVLLI